MEKVSHTGLTPLMFLERASIVYPNRTAIVHEDRALSYSEMADQSTRLARALLASGIEPGDRVAYLCPNIPEMLIAHFGVPLMGGVLVAINTRLSGEEIKTICNHSGARMLVADTELLTVVEPVVDGLTTVEEYVAIDDTAIGTTLPSTDYGALLERGSSEPLPWRVDDEESTISINYTSGTTGQPKGVMYSHRGAYLNALGEMMHSGHSPDSVYLWTLPMFHCNGWCTTWGVTALGGRHVCLRAVDFKRIWQLMDEQQITHLNGAPTVLIGMANAPEAAPFKRPVTITTAGAPPSPTIISTMEKLGARIVHLYGLTETYGPHTVCEKPDGFADLDAADRAKFLARQGVAFVTADPIRVVDEEMKDVPRDGKTMGEVIMRGNNVMKGYFDDPEATDKAFAGGWFHSGDVAVWHPDGYIELRDRAKDIIISGGENISTIEVEQAIASHEAVLEVAVVSQPSEKWGERPKAFVVLKDGHSASPEAIIEHVRARIARYKAPDEVDILEALPKTSTGKVQKFVLRDKEWEGHESRIYGGSG